MSSSPKRKLCWNCDGSVSAAVDQCTYCGANLKEGAAPKQVKRSSEEYKPPFALPRAAEAVAEVPPPPFAVLGKETGALAEGVESESISSTALASPLKESLAPLLCLLGGSVFFLFGLAQWLFAQNGVFTLQWSSDYWHFYLVGGTALLAAGWRALNQLSS